MSNPNKAKADQFERDVVAYLRDHGFTSAERRYGAGAQSDRGDINAVPGLVLEAKNHTRLELAAWMDELGVEIENAHVTDGFLIVKRRRANVDAAYVVQTLAQFARREEAR